MAPVDSEKQKRTQKPMRLNPYIRTKWIPVLAVLITGVFLLIGCSATSANHSNHSNGTPIISALTAEKETVFPSQQCEITCVASDPDGDNLTYKWAANGGSVSGDGSVVTWTAPDAEGTYAVTVAVSDGNGSQNISYLSIEVVETHAPVIEDLTITPEDSDPEGLQVHRGEICYIVCVASDQDGDELGYEWSTDGGSISGEGATATWTAPDAVGAYNITVVVTDGQGGESRDSLTIDVRTNHRPVIEDLIITPLEDDDNFYPETMTIIEGTSCEIECIASDSDDDKLSYEWSIEPAKALWTDVGSLSDEDDYIAIWRAPDRSPREVRITVTVSDGRGGKDTESIVIEVASCECAAEK